jgi:uncharacterized membrane protein
MDSRTVAGAAAALAGVVSIGLAIWGAPFRIADVGMAELPVGPLTIVYFLAGLLAILALPMTSRNPAIARIMLAAGGVILIGGVLILAGWHRITWTALVPGVVMLLATPFLSRRPPYASEAEPRGSGTPNQ